VKYFFLVDGWHVGRVWEFGGLWNESAWKRRPHIKRTNLHIMEQDDPLWLYQVEDAVLMVEVMPEADHPSQDDYKSIGQVVLKRLITADQALERLNAAQGSSSAMA